MKSVFWLAVCSFLSLTISIATIIYLCYTGDCYGIKNINFGDASVAVLSAIVGLLVGWQIYKTIEVNNKLNNVESRYKAMVENEISKVSKYVKASTEFTQGMMVFADDNTLNLDVAYDFLSSALLHYIEYGDDIDINAQSCINNMEYVFEAKDRWDVKADYAKIDKTIKQIIEKGGLRKEFMDRIYDLENRRKEYINIKRRL